MTLKEIAALAGVSPAAVSRYLNGGSLSKEKREQIRQVVEQTDYHPNRLAHDLRKGSARQVGVIVPKIHSTSVSEVLEGITDVLSKEQYLTMLCCTEGDEEKEPDFMDLLQSYQVAGLIVMGTTVTKEREKQYQELEVPVVITGQSYDSLDCICHEDRQAMYVLAEKMLEKGRRNLAYIGVRESDPAAGRQRRLGAQQALSDWGIDPESMPTAIADFSVKSGYRAMQALLDDGLRPDGVLAATDSIAQGAMLALKEAGLRVPEDVSIAGIGNDEIDRISEPRLTTVKLYQYECGREAAKMLLSRLENEGEAMPPRKIRMGFTLMERGSI